MQARKQPLGARALACVAALCALLLAAPRRSRPTSRSEGCDESAASRPARCMIPLVWLPAGLLAWIYVSTHDSRAPARQLQAGHKVTWPPAPKHGPTPAPIATAEHLARRRRRRAPRRSRWLLVVLALAVVVSRAASPPARGRARRRGGSCGSAATTSPTPTASKRPSRASPARSRSRWYERLWRGRDHFALEIHRLPDLSIRFTVAAPRDARARDPRAAGGPLPRRRADRGRRPARPGRAASCGSRSARPFVLSIQTTRNYEHAFTESLVALLSAARARDDRPARAHAGARLRAPPRAAAAQAPRARAAARRHARPRRARHRLRRRSQGAQGRARAPTPLAAVLRPARHRPRPDDRPPRRRPVLAAALRERARAPRDAPAPARSTPRRIAAALPNPLPGLRTGVLSTSELATLWQLPRARVKHARLPRATVRRAIAPPEIERDAGARAAARRARPGLDRRRRTASTATR